MPKHPALFCLAYGLSIRTDTPIPGLPSLASHDGAHDLDLVFTRVPSHRQVTIEVRLPPRDVAQMPVPILAVHDQRLLAIQYDDGVRFEIDAAARTVWCSWPPSSTLEDAATYLLGPILALILRMRGVVCLHASAVVIGGQALLFVGPAGSGKSTTAAALSRAGHTVIADDVAALDVTAGSVEVRPAYPVLRLWPDAVESLYGSVDAIPLLTPNWHKRMLDLTTNHAPFPTKSVPLGAIYLLGDSSPVAEAAIRRLPAGSGALLELIANSYPSTMLDARMRADELTILARVAAAVPVYTLGLPADVARIADALLDATRAIA